MKNWTAVELADALDSVPNNTAVMSMLDEATLAYADKSAALADAQRRFGTARYEHQRSFDGRGYSDETWGKATQAARQLADLLRPFGHTRIERCQEECGWGVCNAPLIDGTCPISAEQAAKIGHPLPGKR